MRWVAIIEDSPEMAKIRDTGHPSHLAYLKQHPGEILIAGPRRKDPGGPIIGGLWVMEVRDRERAVHLVENDPYFKSRYRTYQLYTWDKALPDQSVTL